jgi:hypothetical protein
MWNELVSFIETNMWALCTSRCVYSLNELAAVLNKKSQAPEEVAYIFKQSMQERVVSLADRLGQISADSNLIDVCTS